MTCATPNSRPAQKNDHCLRSIRSDSDSYCTLIGSSQLTLSGCLPSRASRRAVRETGCGPVLREAEYKEMLMMEFDLDQTLQRMIRIEKTMAWRRRIRLWGECRT